MKNINMWIPFLTVLFFSCDEISSKKNVVEGDKATNDYQLDWNKWKRECLCDDSLLINGKLPLKTSKKELITLLGQPTSKCGLQGNCLGWIGWDNKETIIDSLYFYENTIFKCSREDVFAYIIDFIPPSKIQLIHPRISLDIDTKFSDIQKAFPESIKLRRGGGNVWSGYIQIAASKTESQDKLWFLVIHGEKLKRMVLYDVPRIITNE